MVVRARDIMTERVVTIWEDAPPARAEQRMAEFRYSALPVVDRMFRLVGIISLVDILRHRDEPVATVGEIMTREVLYMSPGANLAILAHRLRAYGELRLMPIVDRGVLVGVVTRSDLLRRRQTSGNPVLRGLRKVVGSQAPERDLSLAEPRGAGRIAGRDPATLRVADIMTDTDLQTIAPTTPLEEAAEVLLAFRFTAVPVVEYDDRLVGILSEADLMSGPLEGGRRTRARTVRGVMTTDVEALGPDEPLTRARALLSIRGFRIVPVVDEDDRLIGVLSRSDLL